MPNITHFPSTDGQIQAFHPKELDTEGKRQAVAESLGFSNFTAVQEAVVSYGEKLKEVSTEATPAAAPQSPL